MHKKLPQAARKEQIMSAALKQAAALGYQTITREIVAAAADVSPATVSLHFGTMVQFRRSIMRAAVAQRVLPVVAQGLVAKDAQARKAPAELKLAALNAIAQ